MKRFGFFCISMVFFNQINAASVDYDLCRDILRDGIRDTINSSGASSVKKSLHYEFCSVAKKHNLSDNSFHSFARDYARIVQKKNDKYKGGLDVGIGPFSFDGTYQQHNSNHNDNEKDIEDILDKNSKKIIDYYEKNCSDSTYAEFLQSEATVMSSIASASVVEAWRDCMLKQSGFFVQLTPVGSDKDDTLEYDITSHWKSSEGTKIISLRLQYQKDKLTSSYKEAEEIGDFVKTQDICEAEGCKLKTGSKLSFGIIHKDRTKAVSVRVIAKTNTSILMSQTLILPQKITLPDVKLDPADAVGLPVFAMESYCDDRFCSEFEKGIFSEEFKISSDFVRTIKQLQRGTCSKCKNLKAIRFRFENCRYKIKYEIARSRMMVESQEEISSGLKRYYYPFEKGRDYCSAIRITTMELNDVH